MTPRGPLTVPDVRDVPVYIYALCEPVGLIRYIGKSHNPEARIGNHAAQGSRLVRAWIASLAARGERPVVVRLRTVSPGEDASAAERETIEAYAGAGLPLLNCDGVVRSGAPAFQLPDPPQPSSNRGQLLLREALASHGAASRLAKELNVNPAVISRWLRGRRPTTSSRLALCERLGIDPDSWDEPVVEAA